MALIHAPRSVALTAVLATSLYGVSGPAAALEPADAFRRAQPSLSAVEALSADGRVLGAATAIAVGQGRFVTVCTVLDGSDAIRLTTSRSNATATPVARDLRRNLCLLSAPALQDVAAIELAPKGAELQAGERVFAVSNALGLGIGISEGVISGLRRFGDSTLLQFSAPISPGSAGGALLDAQARLIGVIDYRQRDGQNVNFAAPAAWIAEIEARNDGDARRQAWRDRAPRLLRERDAAALTELAGEWTQAEPDEVDGWAWLALAAQLRGDFTAEEQAWRRARSLDKATPLPGLGVAGALLRQRRFDEARGVAQELLAVRQEDAAIWLLLARAHHGSGAQTQAEEAYRKVLTLDPWQAAAHEGLITLAMQRGDHAAAQAGWARLVRLYPDRPELRWRQLQSLLLAGQSERAWAVLERLPAELAASGDGLLWRAQTLAALKRPAQAIDVMRDSLAKQVSDPSWAWSELGKLYHRLHRFPESIAAHREAVRLAPQIADRRFWLAVSLKDGGHLAEALDIDRQLVAELPNEAGAWRQLGMASAAAARTDDSIAALERSLAIEPRQARLWSLLIEQYHAAGRRDDVLRAHASLRGLDAAAAERAYRATIAPYAAGAVGPAGGAR